MVRCRRHDIPFSTGLFASDTSSFPSRDMGNAIAHITTTSSAQNMPLKQAAALLDD
jgi:hypothetical protein